MGNEFDSYADNYETALGRGLALAGESQEYFARERVRWVSRCLPHLKSSSPRVLDFGCGTGGATPHLLEVIEPASVLGVDTSEGSLAIARETHRDPRTTFQTVAEPRPTGRVDLAFCNGVFHHIPPSERPEALRDIHESLTPGGYFAFWENNPWNPGTRLVMRRIPFDRDAQVISAPAAAHLLRGAGFAIVRIDFLFVFPHMLRACRPLEPYLAKLPLGGQYQVLARREPDGGDARAGR